MLFGQKLHPANFEYGTRIVSADDALEVRARTFRARIRCSQITTAIARLRFENSHVADPRQFSDGVVSKLRAGKGVAATGRPFTFRTAACTIEVAASRLKVTMASGVALTTADEGFGCNGERTIFNFHAPAATGFYGFGERTKRFNKTGDTLDFCNVDVCAVFQHTSHRDDYDPAYVSIPLAIIRAEGACLGLYIDNPERLVMDAGHITPGNLICQSLAGHNDLYFIDGPTLRDVVRNFCALTGRAEVPPLWSLGHHQCRWGYKTAEEFRALRDHFARCDVPVSALWYDIDYMDGYRVFTWNPEAVPAPGRLNRELKKGGIRSVAIVDPGVKLEAGNAVYESGKRADVFCRTRSGREYVGRVWPGDTVFPDFSQQHARQWWGRHLSRFIAESALDGAWIDMNEPATGWSDAEDMRFEGGTVPHGAYHNQYGHFMAKATWEALARRGKGSRPFVLTRSGFTGTQRYSAVWTGDNASNWEHLRMSIPCTINLGLSGVAFNGPDVGGFSGNTEEELLTRWYQAGFLFPFLRNHSTNHTKEQEPWNFGPDCLRRIRDAVLTRYRLLPYLYQCFFHHHLTGDPVLRPLLFEFSDPAFENLDDQFLVGGHILVAPILESGTTGRSVVVRGRRRQQRHVTLPEGAWFDLSAGAWTEGGRTIVATACLDEVPIYIRDGAVIPWFAGKVRNSEMALDRIELHAFLKQSPGSLEYYIDDRETRAYLKGAFNRAAIAVSVEGGRARVRIEESGKYRAGTVQFAPVFYGGAVEQVAMEVDGVREVRRLKPATRRWVGQDVAVRA